MVQVVTQYRQQRGIETATSQSRVGRVLNRCTPQRPPATPIIQHSFWYQLVLLDVQDTDTIPSYNCHQLAGRLTVYDGLTQTEKDCSASSSLVTDRHQAEKRWNNLVVCFDFWHRQWRIQSQHGESVASFKLHQESPEMSQILKPKWLEWRQVAFLRINFETEIWENSLIRMRQSSLSQIL